MPSNNGSAPLPVASSERWKPLRSGLLNIFKFDEEEFIYENGRLLLRGNNGAGKSRVLALQLPFLLDGELGSHRVEPDGDSAKRMDWNLLMGKHDDRTGYTWIEFGRCAPGQEPEYRTLGCGLRAVKGKGIHSRWYFLTRQRVGEGIFLQTSERIPLSKDRLLAALADSGSLYEAVKDYRKAVDEALFGLGTRYLPLIELLIRLRQPQLSRKLDEQLLSDALSEALSPLPNTLLEDAADAFRGLENNRAELLDFQEALAGVERFLQEYRQYAQLLVKRRTDGLRRAHSEYESTQRSLNAFKQELDEKKASLKNTKVAFEEGSVVINKLVAEEQTLRNSPEMKSLENLNQARDIAKQKRQIAGDASKRLKEDEALFDTSATEYDEASTSLAQRREQADESWREAAKGCLEIGLAIAGLSSDSELLPLPEHADSAWLEEQKSIANKGTTKLEHNIGHLRKLNQCLMEAETQRKIKQQSYFSKESDYISAKEAAQKADEERVLALRAFTDAYHVWLHSLAELNVQNADSLPDHYEAWLEMRDVQNPYQVAIKDAQGSAQSRLASLRSDVLRRLDDLLADQNELQAELEQYREGRHEPPPAPYFRRVEDRGERPGAPLWKTIEFREHLTMEQCAGYEAALEASGLLDAWILPSGELVSVDTQDTFFTVNDSGTGKNTEDLGLSAVMAVTLDPTDSQLQSLSLSLVEAILRRIGAGNEDSGGVWVSDSGQWCTGLLQGAWTKPEPEHIGHASREAARRRRMVELDAQLASLADKIVGVEGELAQVTTREEVLANEVATAPNEQDVLESVFRLEGCQCSEKSAFDKFRVAETELEQARRKHTEALEKRDTDALDLGLVKWKDQVDALTGCLSNLRLSLSNCWHLVQSWIDVSGQTRRAHTRYEAAKVRHAESQTGWQQADKAASAAEVHYQTLESTIGKEAHEVMQRLEDLVQTLSESRECQEELDKLERKLDVEIEVLKTQISTAEKTLQTQSDERARWAERLYVLARHRLLSEADTRFQFETTQVWAATRAVEIARQIERQLPPFNDLETRWQRQQNSIVHHIQSLTDDLSARNHQVSTQTVEEGALVVSCQFQGAARTMSEMSAALAEEIVNHQQLLDEREREIIENHLVGEIASEIQRLIRSGEHWIHQINEELDLRPTSSGIKLRFAWSILPDAPADLAQARQLLLRTSAAWSPSDRQAIGTFLQQQIKTEKMADETATWQQHLSRALDYRRWHRFEIERHQDGTWKKLTRRTYGTGSGGEKAIALTIPQFAAAAAHYRSASPQAPRLIMLDEAFVGIDAATRAKLMELLETFDLDLVMTSEREWGCYSTLPGLAIYQLASHPTVDAVAVSRWVWNGHERKSMDPSAPRRRPVLRDSQDSLGSDGRSLFNEE